MYPPCIKTYSVEITGIVEVIANFTIAACNEDEAITNAEILFKQEFVAATIHPVDKFNIVCDTPKNLNCTDCHEEKY